MSAPPRIHITGASGSGTTTLGEALARRFGCAHLDTDEFFWLPTDPPFRTARDRLERLRMIELAFEAAANGWVHSGSLDGWGDPLISCFDHVVFLTAPTEIRLARLTVRERQRYGGAIDPGESLHAHHREFLDYAAGYDSGEFAGPLTGRYRARHEAWLARLTCPVIRLDGMLDTDQLMAAVAAASGLQRP